MFLPNLSFNLVAIFCPKKKNLVVISSLLFI